LSAAETQIVMMAVRRGPMSQRKICECSMCARDGARSHLEVKAINRQSTGEVHSHPLCLGNRAGPTALTFSVFVCIREGGV